MKQIIFNLYIILVILSSCTQEKRTDNQLHKQRLESIQGIWTTKSLNLDYTNVIDEFKPTFDGPNVSSRVNVNWLISGDTIFHFDYPFEFKEKIVIKQINDSLFFTDKSNELWQINNTSNSLIVFTKGNDSEPKKSYQFSKDSINLKKLNDLMQMKVNYTNLIKEFTLQRTAYLCDGPLEKLDFPVKLPLYRKISDELEAKKILSAKKISLIIDDKSQLFNVKQISWHNFSGYWDCAPDSLQNKIELVLTPDSWWKGSPFQIIYLSQ